MMSEAEAKNMPAKYMLISSPTRFNIVKNTAVTKCTKAIIRLLILFERNRFLDSGLFTAVSGARKIIEIVENTAIPMQTYRLQSKQYVASIPARNIAEVAI